MNSKKFLGSFLGATMIFSQVEGFIPDVSAKSDNSNNKLSTSAKIAMGVGAGAGVVGALSLILWKCLQDDGKVVNAGIDKTKIFVENDFDPKSKRLSDQQIQKVCDWLNEDLGRNFPSEIGDEIIRQAFDYASTHKGAVAVYRGDKNSQKFKYEDPANGKVYPFTCLIYYDVKENKYKCIDGSNDCDTFERLGENVKCKWFVR